MKIKAYAKINIALDVVGKREDGYHLLRMIMQTVDLYDVIEIVKTNSDIKLKCNGCAHIITITRAQLKKQFKETTL